MYGLCAGLIPLSVSGLLYKPWSLGFMVFQSLVENNSRLEVMVPTLISLKSLFICFRQGLMADLKLII